ncbi:hypothetical protein CDL12_00983 [Handroanthus impetiginosus]|uniref:Myb/SANT-like domain-containing protein n=1 Tax=Handroanthus impetiginosus TaxID=429701 RepID=A0A2G9I935_9LAMI|nr:hypothetical protein CDL12_00983 [Handroanthus impetiginosus]
MENQDKRNKGLALNANVGKSTSKIVTKINEASEGRSSVRWDLFLSLKFIELCEDEIGKENRPNSHFNVNGWKNLETGVGWNPIKNSLDAFDEWWERKIKENSDYSKFRNKDLSLIWFRYDTLFCDVAAMGERARALSQRSGNEIDSYEEMLEDNGESNNQKEEQVHIGDSDDTENIKISDYNVNSKTKKTNSVSNEIFHWKPLKGATCKFLKSSYSSLKRKKVW